MVMVPLGLLVRVRQGQFGELGKKERSEGQSSNTKTSLALLLILESACFTLSIAAGACTRQHLC